MYTVTMARTRSPEAPASRLVFKPLDLPADGRLAVRFSEDAFVCSFGTAERFWAEAGRDGQKWLDRLSEKLAADPRSAVNAWMGDKIAGQVILGRSDSRVDVGHVNLYYLAPEFRGRGLAEQLDAYSVTVLRAQGFLTATLHVSPNNLLALRFYARSGWRSLGPTQDAPHVTAMERSL